MTGFFFYPYPIAILGILQTSSWPFFQCHTKHSPHIILAISRRHTAHSLHVILTTPPHVILTEGAHGALAE